MKARSWASSRKMEDVSLSPVCDSRLGDSRPGRPGCSSLGLSWIPAPEQRFGGRPGRELQGERQRLISTHRITSSERSGVIVHVGGVGRYAAPSLISSLSYLHKHSRTLTHIHWLTHTDSQLIQVWHRSVQLHLKQPDICTCLWMKRFQLWVRKHKSYF